MCIVNLLSALLTPLIAGFAVYIAWQQWQTNKRNLKNALFDKRYKVYEAAREFVAAVVVEGKAQEVIKLKATRAARFLFYADITAYIKEMFQKNNELKLLEDTLKGLPQGDKRDKNVEKQGEIKGWFEKEWQGEIENRFAPYLQLKD